MNKLFDRISGGIIGFMIGDALGLPIAGIQKTEVKKTVGFITTYATNYKHPFFYFLKKGQYGSNSRLLLVSLESLVKNKGYKHSDLVSRLKTIAKKSKRDFFYSRWLGESATKALLSGQPVNSHSCTCIYRSIPIALLYDDFDKALFFSEKQTKITHISPVSLATSFFITYLLFHLKQRLYSLDVIVDKAILEMEKKYENCEILTQKLRLVLNKEIKETNQARYILGTGSLAHQTVPMSLYLFLRYKKNFAKAVILGANSTRKDNKEEKEKLANMSYITELLECRGGATDGIAALTGSFIGTYNGYQQIPVKFLNELEDREKVLNLLKQD